CTGLLEQDFPELCARAGITSVPKITLRPPPKEPEEPALEEVLGRNRVQVQLLPALHPGGEGDPGPLQRPRHLPAGLEDGGGHAGGAEPVPAHAGGAAGSAPLEGRADGAAAPGAGGDAATLPTAPDPHPGGEPPARTRLPHADGERQHADPPLPAPQTTSGDAAARLIGRSLSSLSSANRRLASLVLSFNHISDAGAGYIAEGLRLNRSLLSLSLASNDIGDAGAGKLAEVLGPFALTHAEVVERRRLLLAEALGQSRVVRQTPPPPTPSPFPRGNIPSLAPDWRLPGGSRHPEPPHSAAPSKHGKAPKKKVRKRGGAPGIPGSPSPRQQCPRRASVSPHFSLAGEGSASCCPLPPPLQEMLRPEESRHPRKSPEPRAARGRDGKPGAQEKRLSEVPELAEPLHPLLEARQEQGSVILPGNRVLLDLNLTYNHITERGLGAFLVALEGQRRERRPEVPGQQGLRCLGLEEEQHEWGP
ncbi:LOW QUALITY PROTEIN: leucine-rich repeat-containing protein 71, partial [Porphyrio hochstetteri]